jgi:hypothetical protein
VTVVELILVVGGVAMALLAIFAVIEKTTSVVSRWQGRVVEQATAPLREDVQELRRFSQFHLGPNGSAKQLFRKVDDLIDDFNEHIRREDR